MLPFPAGDRSGVSRLKADRQRTCICHCVGPLYPSLSHNASHRCEGRTFSHIRVLYLGREEMLQADTSAGQCDRSPEEDDENQVREDGGEVHDLEDIIVIIIIIIYNK